MVLPVLNETPQSGWGEATDEPKPAREDARPTNDGPLLDAYSDAVTRAADTIVRPSLRLMFSKKADVVDNAKAAVQARVS